VKRAMPKGHKPAEMSDMPMKKHMMPDSSMMKGKMMMPEMPPKGMPMKAAPKKRK
jgi:hypothetical protein